MKLILWNGNGEEVVNTTMTKKSSLTARCSGKTFSKGYIKVEYPLGKEYYNDCEFDSMERLNRMLSMFTEFDLVKDLS